MIKMLSPEEANDLLHNGRLARLGCIVDGEPYVVPVNYYLEDGYAYIHSLPGRKIEALRAHPRACLQVDSITEEAHWRSAIAYGNYEEIKSPDARASVMSNFLRHFPLLTPVEASVFQAATSLAIIVFRLRIDRVEGVRES